jgi:hypothetical protein
MKPGIYNISNEEYHSSEGISRSGLMLFKKSAKHYWNRYLNPNRKPEKETYAKKFGNAMHVSILEHDLFKDNYVILPKIDRRTKIGKEQWAEWEKKNADKEIISIDDYEKILEITQSIRDDDYAANLIDNAEYEQSIYWEDEETGILCKARPDIMHDNIICDLKSTADASEFSFMNSAYRYGYHIQAAMLKDGFEKITKKELKAVVLIAFEKEPPYAVKSYIVDDSAIEKGQEEYKALLKNYKESLTENKWKSYGASYLFLPSYAFY